MYRRQRRVAARPAMAQGTRFESRESRRWSEEIDTSSSNVTARATPSNATRDIAQSNLPSTPPSDPAMPSLTVGCCLGDTAELPRWDGRS